MKTNLILILIFIFGYNFCNAQSPVYKEATLSHPVELWEPVKLSNDGGNILNGVHFYGHIGECNSEKVKFVKLVNLNPYSVKFNYQLSETSPVVTVIVPASLSIDGSCESTDQNLKKLVLIIPSVSNDVAKKNKEFLQSHISITKAK